MRFPADESCDFAVVRILRTLGRELMELAYSEGRILLTEDKDFGWLAFVAHVASPGVVLIRFPAFARKVLADSVSRLVAEFGPKLNASFTVLRPGDVRISRLPPEIRSEPKIPRQDTGQ